MKPHPTLHLLTIVAVMAVVMALSPQQSAAQIGFAGGLNYASLNDVNTQSGRSTFDSSTGYHVGIFADIGVGPIKVRPGVFYRDAGELISDFDGVPKRSDLSMIEVPLDLRIQILPTPFVKPYVSAGPVISFASSSDAEFDASLRDFAVSANVAAGVSFGLPGVGMRIFPEIRYAFGVTRFMEDTIQINDITFQSQDVVRMNAVMLRVGVIL